ncbi:MAG: nucleoside triphosphate pyrophosphohydrolase [Dehalococcoidia bacterium]
MTPKATPPPEPLESFDTLVSLVNRLRSPEGCPWDREQTHASLKRSLLEESYEVLEAIDEARPDRLAEELGDVLLQVVFQAQIADEGGEFHIRDVLWRLNEKLIRRHPHVFGDATVADAREVEHHWEELKRQEGRGEESRLGGLPREMPALLFSQVMQDRAARAGFDWDELAGALDKAVEELRELQVAGSQEERTVELGDLLFALVSLARWLGAHAEDALRQANLRFHARFTALERLCRQRGLTLAELPLERKEALWQEVKRLEG